MRYKRYLHVSDGAIRSWQSWHWVAWSSEVLRQVPYLRLLELELGGCRYRIAPGDQVRHRIGYAALH